MLGRDRTLNNFQKNRHAQKKELILFPVVLYLMISV